jgi:hypothetical protein
MSPFTMHTLCVVIFIATMTPYILLLRRSQESFGLLGVGVTAGLFIGPALLLAISHGARLERPRLEVAASITNDFLKNLLSIHNSDCHQQGASLPVVFYV